MINEIFLRRFTELETQYNALPFGMDGQIRRVFGGAWKQWATSVQNLIRAVCGETGPHYQQFTADYKTCGGYHSELNALHSVFLSAKTDFEGGYIFDADLRVSGEVFGDFIALAKQALNEGYKDVAAVLACASLEDALKRYAGVNGLNVDQKTMQDVVNALKSNGLVSGAQKSLLDAMPRIRNQAMHADWGKLSEPDVNSVIGFVEQFLLTKFSHP